MPNATALRLITLLLAGAASAAAADVPPGPPHFDQPLTLVQLTDLALKNNPSTKLAWAEIRNSEAGLELARAGYWPQLELDYSLSRAKQTTAGGVSNPAATSYGPSLSLSWLLWDFGTRSGRTDAAKFALTASQLDANQTMQDLILTVEQDYYQVLGLQALQDADAQSVQDASANLDAANQRRGAGLATLGDVYQAEAALATAQLALQTAAGQLAVARGQLAVAVGYDADTPLPLATLEKAVAARMPDENVRALLEKAGGARPELLAAKAQEQQALASLEAADGQGWPTLGLSGSTGRTTTRLADGTSTTNRNWNAGLSLSFPLFTGFANRAESRQAQSQVDIAQANTQALVQAVQLEVWQAYQNMHTAVSTLDTAAAGLKSAQQAADVTNARYKNGLDSILDVLSAQAALANARVQDVQARLNWFAAQAAMGHAVGGLDAPKDPMELP
ncbi:MAG: TolC family protein [Bacillota bacterium]